MIRRALRWALLLLVGLPFAAWAGAAGMRVIPLQQAPAAMPAPASATTTATVSIGVSAREADTVSPEALVEQADAAQYQAKTDGRNRVVAYQPDLSATAPAA